MSQQDLNQKPAIGDDGDSLLVERKRGVGPAIIVSTLGFIAVLILSAPFWLSGRNQEAKTNFDDTRDFAATPAGQPYLTPPPPVAPPPVVVATPAPAPVAAPAPAAQEPASNDDDAALWQRYRSPMVITENSQPPGPTVPKLEDADKGKAEKTFQETNANSQFLSNRASAPVEVAKAERTPRIDALVAQGTMIRGVLETAINTDLPGMVRAVTREDVWSFDGRRVLIPSGTRLIGEYNAGVQQNQKRAFIVWTRLIRPDGISVSIGSIGTDDLGRSGMDGDVDNHYLARYGPVLLVSILAGGAQVLSTTNNYGSNGPITTTYVNPATGQPTSLTTYPNGQGGQLAAQGAQAVAQGFSQTAQEMLKASQAIQPTITIDQGALISIFVRRDLDFSRFYPDPVLQVYRDLKNGKRR